MLVDCAVCDAKVDAEVRDQFARYEEEGGYLERYSFARCPVCGSPLVLSETEWQPDQFSSPTRIYPPKQNAFIWSVPDPIKDAFQEATKCFNANAFTASAIMCRKTLEGVSANHRVDERNLQRKLETLKEQGVIEGRLFEWANQLRIVGNDAAHDVDVQVTAEDARDTLDFTRALLNYVYTLRDQFEEFQKRRAQKRAARSDAAAIVEG